MHYVPQDLRIMSYKGLGTVIPLTSVGLQLYKTNNTEILDRYVARLEYIVRTELRIRSAIIPAV